MRTFLLGAPGKHLRVGWSGDGGRVCRGDAERLGEGNPPRADPRPHCVSRSDSGCLPALLRGRSGVRGDEGTRGAFSCAPSIRSFSASAWGINSQRNRMFRRGGFGPSEEPIRDIKDGVHRAPFSIFMGVGTNETVVAVPSAFPATFPATGRLPGLPLSSLLPLGRFFPPS